MRGRLVSESRKLNFLTKQPESGYNYESLRSTRVISRMNKRRNGDDKGNCSL
jgi:hypothetical protein